MINFCHYPQICKLLFLSCWTMFLRVSFLSITLVTCWCGLALRMVTLALNNLIIFWWNLLIVTCGMGSLGILAFLLINPFWCDVFLTTVSLLMRTWSDEVLLFLQCAHSAVRPLNHILMFSLNANLWLLFGDGSQTCSTFTSLLGSYLDCK